ncbi:MAG: hypothetical protein RL112_1833, partial [Planctomycetota bacterium]
ALAALRTLLALDAIRASRTTK